MVTSDDDEDTTDATVDAIRSLAEVEDIFALSNLIMSLDVKLAALAANLLSIFDRILIIASPLEKKKKEKESR